MHIATNPEPVAVAERLDTTATALDEAVRRARRAQAWGQLKAALAAPLRPSVPISH